MNNFWKNKRVLVTGGTGFIGSHLVERLQNQGAKVTVFDRLTHGYGYLTGISKQVRFIKGDCGKKTDANRACYQQNIIFNLAAHVGGIEYNRTHQATMLKDNLQIAMTMMEAALQNAVDRFLVVSSACVYPHDAVIPTPESEGFRAEPEPTNGGYGWAKRISEKLGMYYREEYGLRIGIVRPYNCYGPRDHFDVNKSHVIPALIKRVMDGENPIIVWGTGKQSRSFLYVDDLVYGLMLAIEKYPQPDPINLGTDEEITVEELIKSIIHLCKKNTKIIFDINKPDGSPRRLCDTAKAKRLIGFSATTRFLEGLKNTIDWYKENYNC